MSKSLENALEGNPWSVSAVIFDLNDILDDEGRPISERRADAVVRAGVEMEMRKCPFPGIRFDKWMNVSALTQITHYYNDALAELAAFRRCADGKDVTWDDIFACVVDLLAGPAIYLLKQRNSKGPVPASLAVCHKLAAGMFGVLRGLLERLALGAEIPVTVDSFLDLVEETGALVGTSEACAGSLPMIRKASTVLLEGNNDQSITVDPERLAMARHMALQVQLGIYWHLYDRVHLWSLVKGEFRQHLVPFNTFLERKLDQAGSDMDADAPSRPHSNALPDVLDEQVQERFAQALNDVAEPPTLEEDLQTAIELIEEPGSAISYKGDVRPFAVKVANYLNTYRLFEAELSRVELMLRKQLGFSMDTPIRHGIAAFPYPQALAWYELILGRKLGADGRLTGESKKIEAGRTR